MFWFLDVLEAVHFLGWFVIGANSLHAMLEFSDDANLDGIDNGAASGTRGD